MACYFGCRGCCAKMRWFLFVVTLLAAIACLTAGLIKTIPDFVILFKCTTKDKSLQESAVCWQDFWKTSGPSFVVLCIGAGALLLALFTCCCFCAASAPGSRRKAKGQFIQGEYDAGAAAGADQYGGYGAPKPSVAHV